MAKHLCEELVEKVEQVQREVPKTYQAMINGLNEFVNGPDGKFFGSAAAGQWLVRELETMLREDQELANQCLEYIKTDVLPWALSPMELEATAKDYDAIGTSLSALAGDMDPRSTSWGDTVEWQSPGAKIYAETTKLQQEAVDAAITMTTSVRDVLLKAATASLTNLTDAINHVLVAVIELISLAVGCGSWSAVFTMGEKFGSAIKAIGKALISIVSDYTKLCIDAKEQCMKLSDANNAIARLPGDGWPTASAGIDSGGEPGVRRW